MGKARRRHVDQAKFEHKSIRNMKTAVDFYAYFQFAAQRLWQQRV